MNYKILPSLAALSCGIGISWLIANPENKGTQLVATSSNGIPNAQHVIFISCDGLRGDYLESLITNRPASFPNLKKLRDNSAYTFKARTDYNYSETIPDHCCMITGRPVLDPAGAPAGTGHGFTANTGNIVTDSTSTIHQPLGSPTFSYKSSVFDVVHEAGLTTTFFHSKDRMAFIDRSYNSTYGALGAVGAVNPARDKIDRATGTISGSTSSTAVMTNFFTDLTTNPLATYTFLHFVDPDKAGHANNWILTTPPAAMSAWENAVATSDASLGQLFAWLEQPANAAIKATTTIIFTADHGGGGFVSNNHTEEEYAGNYTIPFFIHGSGFKAGSDVYQYFSNRSNPGTARVTDTVSSPPIRNGDAANLALALLGLPEVPGSYFKPELINPETTTLISIQPGGANPAQVKWPISATSYSLETTTNLATGPWTAVTTGLTTTAEHNVHSFTPGGANKYFRLKKN